MRAAELIVADLARGHSERDIAVEISRSRAHVHFMAAAWRFLLTPEGADYDFAAAYRKVQGKPPKNNAMHYPSQRRKPTKPGEHLKESDTGYQSRP